MTRPCGFRGIHEMPIDPESWHYLRPRDLLFGMEGKAWLWQEALVWRSGSQPKSAVIKIKRKAKPFWAVIIPENVSINAGDVEDSTWVEIEVVEPRNPLNLDGFQVIVEGMQGMGSAMQDLGIAFSSASRAIASGGHSMGKLKKGKRTVMVPVVDPSDGQLKVMSMSEEKAKKLKFIAGHSIADVVLDEMNGTVSFDEDGNQTFKSLAEEVQDVLDEDDETETLNISDMLDNLFEPKP